jgi:hypothetical protein
MTDLYSQRVRGLTDVYRYDVPEKVRARLIHVVLDLGRRTLNRHLYMQAFDEVATEIRKQHGGLHRSSHDAANVADDPLLNHFCLCSDELALDFIEALFRTMWGCEGQQGVEAVNQVFREEGLGYELTDRKEIDIKDAAGRQGRRAGRQYQIVYPRIVRKDGAVTHQLAVHPCLAALDDKRFQEADKEFRKALDECRQGRYADAITSAGSALESILRTICVARGWITPEDKATCRPLIEICQRNDVFPNFYAEVISNTCTLRNRLGDAHGRGASNAVTPNRDNAEHMLAITAANIVLVVRYAQL